MRIRGFTLIEVLVAMTVFAVAALAVIKSTSQHTRSLSYLEEKTLASIVADNQLTLLFLNGEKPASEKKGNVEMAGRTWYWTLKPTATQTGQLRAIDMQVFTSKERANNIISVRTYVPTS
ncbi:type II secretion system minor pseudopilin GspI [Veronia pacifica]|uniref:Type II secretion system protein I n=1 Tax=Veronia pacifica TaxID=1080227 RepID=A0A1C3EJQ2_9GAMM|nr:type II secretion system minor pseudopilin GspI [Veronia pacifica]ODA33462.1 type II secretion system protein GspI [Veronia pacifica]